MFLKFSRLFSLPFLFICTLTFHSLTIKASPTYLYHDCQNTNTATFSSNSSYKTNLNILLSSLESNSATVTNGFYDYKVGNQASNTVYGLFLCRGDVSSDTCKTCVTAARSDLNQNCSSAKVAITFYDLCLLRYSNEPVVSTPAFSPIYIVSNTSNITIERDKFIKLVGETMNRIKGEAARGTDKKFATKEAKFTDSDTLYTLAQCTPDLSTDDCNSCLLTCINALDNGRQGATTMLTSCNVRFEIYPFYNSTATIAPAPAPVALSPPTASTNTSAPPPTLESKAGDKGISTITLVAIVIPVAISATFLTILCFCFLTKRKENTAVAAFLTILCYCFFRNKKEYTAVLEDNSAVDGITNVQSLHYDLRTIETATNNFSIENKIGKGGFGDVYKGTLSNGQEVAVKRLSKASGQGEEQFKNEVLLVAKLQHRNLVRLLGFCLERKEKILIYEYVPNKSLDHILFGLALLKHVGYISPEYAMHGHFSVKSDVYSFGVLILEIISGHKNSHFQQSDRAEDLLSYAWKLWKKDVPLELVDETIRDSYPRNEVRRCIQIGLLCVQEDPDKRPTMASVVLMLNSFSVTLALPKKPAFFAPTRTRTELSFPIMGLESDKSTSKSMTISVNDVSITELHPR
ncbi:Gnk2-homologous domain [Dillenia turbinata]|uniref:Gnk2-homologous domain n=1 Tax=Dillenia turbinata TaxID=194707 RepID=A0AAN8VR54_9MAGN